MAFSFITSIIAILITGALYDFVANWLSFLPGENWEHFLGFLVTIVIISIILALLFLLPRHIIKAIWSSGCASGIVGGILGLVNSAIGIFVLALLIQTYPVMDWLKNAVIESTVLSSILQYLGFLRFLLPETFRGS